MSQPLLLFLAIVGALVALALLGYVLIVRQRARVLAWLRGLFRRPPEPGRPPGPRHYYKPYWS
jgi:hypothetical protein